MHRVQLLASLEPGPVQRWAADALFDDLDLNRDGVVTRDEFHRGMTPLVRPVAGRPGSSGEAPRAETPLHKELLPSTSSACASGDPEQLMQQFDTCCTSTQEARALYGELSEDLRPGVVGGCTEESGHRHFQEGARGTEQREAWRGEANNSQQFHEEALPVQPCRTPLGVDDELEETVADDARNIPMIGQVVERGDQLKRRQLDEALQYTQEAKARNQRLQRESYELHRAAHQVFDAFDVHNNGVITRQEFRRALYKSKQGLGGRFDAVGSADGAVAKVLDQLSTSPRAVRRVSQVRGRARSGSPEASIPEQVMCNSKVTELRQDTAPAEDVKRLACSQPHPERSEQVAQPRGCWREQRRHLGQRASESCNPGAGLQPSSGRPPLASSTGMHACVREQLPHAQETFAANAAIQRPFADRCAEAHEAMSRRWRSNRCAPDVALFGSDLPALEVVGGAVPAPINEQPCERGWRQRGYMDQVGHSTASSHAAPYQQSRFQEVLPVKEQLQPIGQPSGQAERFTPTVMQPSPAVERWLAPPPSAVDATASASAFQFRADDGQQQAGCASLAATASGCWLPQHPEALHGSHRDLPSQPACQHAWQQPLSCDVASSQRIAADKLFDELDVNGDGVISREELLTVLARHMSH